MRLSGYKKIFLNKKWLIIILVIFVLAGTYTKAVDFVKDPEVGVMVPENDYEPAWYIDPATKEKIFLVDSLHTLRAMKAFGIGIKSSTLKRYLKTGFPKNLAGSILLDVQNRGQAYYVSTLNNKGYFLGQPDFALIILRENGFKLGDKEFEVKTDNPLASLKKEVIPSEQPIVEPEKNANELDDKIRENIVVVTKPIEKLISFSKIISVSGELSNDSSLNIEEQGVVFGFLPQPSLDKNDGYAKDVIIKNNFSFDFNNILPSKTYYFKAYVKTSDKVFYGNEQIFISPEQNVSGGGGGSPDAIDFPTIATSNLSINGVSGLSAVGQITNDGGGNIIAKGVCWSTSTGPTLGANCTNDGVGKNEFTSFIYNLDPETIYYVRAYATNSFGTSYGNELVTCGSTTVLDADANSYNVVKIGTQCWLKENLNVGDKVDSAAAAPCTDYTAPSDPLTHYWSCQNDDNKVEKYCYNNNEANCVTDGGLYEWQEAMALPASCVNTDCSAQISSPHQGICPTGWHIPTDNELAILEQRTVAKINSTNTQYPCGTRTDYDRWWLRRCADDNGTDDGGIYGAGKSLKKVGQGSGNGAGDDIVGFSALLAGYRRWDTGGFSARNDFADFWSTGEYYLSGLPFYAWDRELQPTQTTVGRDTGVKSYGLSVRCVKN